MRRGAIVGRRRDLAPVHFKQVSLIHSLVLQRSSLRGALATKQSNRCNLAWIASRSLSSGTHSRDPLVRNDESPPRPQQAALFPAPIALLLALALVVQLLAFRYRQQQLGAAALVEVKLQRDQRHALALDRAHQFIDLLLVQQQLARPLRLVIEAIGLQIF